MPNAKQKLKRLRSTWVGISLTHVYASLHIITSEAFKLRPKPGAEQRTVATRIAFPTEVMSVLFITFQHTYQHDSRRCSFTLGRNPQSYLSTRAITHTFQGAPERIAAAVLPVYGHSGGAYRTALILSFPDSFSRYHQLKCSSARQRSYSRKSDAPVNRVFKLYLPAVFENVTASVYVILQNRLQ